MYSNHTWYILFIDSLGRYFLSKACLVWLMYSFKPSTNSSLDMIWSPFLSKAFTMSSICSSLMFVLVKLFPSRSSFTSEANKSFPPRWLNSLYNLHDDDEVHYYDNVLQVLMTIDMFKYMNPIQTSLNRLCFMESYSPAYGSYVWSSVLS